MRDSYYDIVDDTLNKLNSQITLIAAKVHLVVTVNAKVFRFDQVIDSEEPVSSGIKNMITKSMDQICQNVQGTDVNHTHFSTEIFIKNDEKPPGFAN